MDVASEQNNNADAVGKNVDFGQHAKSSTSSFADSCAKNAGHGVQADVRDGTQLGANTGVTAAAMFSTNTGTNTDTGAKLNIDANLSVNADASTSVETNVLPKVQQDSLLNGAAFRDPQAVLSLVSDIQVLQGRLIQQRGMSNKSLFTKETTNKKNEPIKLMEVCGTHTVSIARAGFRSVMPDGIKLLSGPGCPVCVTANADIDSIIACTRIPNSIVTTYGDMLRVPGSTTSLTECKASGADVKVVYSPLDAIKIAQEHPTKQIIFAAVGFETTAPLVASTVKRAIAMNIKNFSVVVAHKLVPPALRALIHDPDLQLDGLILPGHVSTIIGSKPYEFIASEFKIPAVITGFEPVDILQGITQLLEQLSEGRAAVEIAYKRAVMPEGNTVATATLNDIFETCNAVWRGFGMIANSGLALRSEFADFDALKRFAPETEETVEHSGCLCGDVLRGAISPNSCPLFGKACTPAKPIGPCMVSSEGSCAAYYRYQVID